MIPKQTSPLEIFERDQSRLSKIQFSKSLASHLTHKSIFEKEKELSCQPTNLIPLELWYHTPILWTLPEYFQRKLGLEKSFSQPVSCPHVESLIYLLHTPDLSENSNCKRPGFSQTLPNYLVSRMVLLDSLGSKWVKSPFLFLEGHALSFFVFGW